MPTTSSRSRSVEPFAKLRATAAVPWWPLVLASSAASAFFSAAFLAAESPLVWWNSCSFRATATSSEGKSSNLPRRSETASSARNASMSGIPPSRSSLSLSLLPPVFRFFQERVHSAAV